MTTDSSIFVSGLNGPRMLAFNKQGELFATNWTSNFNSRNNKISRTIINSDGTAGNTDFVVNSDLINEPWGIAFDSKGNLYCSNQHVRIPPEPLGYSTVTKTYIDADGTIGQTENYISIHNRDIFGIAFDSEDNLYCTVTNDAWQIQIITKTPMNENGTAGSTTNFVENGILSYPRSLAFNSAGDLFISNRSGGVHKTTIVDGEAVETNVWSNSGGESIVFDQFEENLYNSFWPVYNAINQTAIIDGVAGNITTVVSDYPYPNHNFLFPIGLAFNTFDSNKYLYCANYNNSYILRYQFATINVQSSFEKTYGNMPFNIDATISNTNYTEQTFSYYSSDENVATINLNGLVTLNNPGSCTITITLDNSSGFIKTSSNTTINVLPSTISNPVIVESTEELDYYLSTNAVYAELTNNIHVSNNLSNSSNEPKILITEQPVVITI